MPKFKGGTHTNYVRKAKRAKKRPCLRISAGPLRGMYVNRLVMAAKLGRALDVDEEVDHIDRDSLNDWPDNLQLMPDTTAHVKVTNERVQYAKDEELALLTQWRGWIQRIHTWACFNMGSEDKVTLEHADMLCRAAAAIRKRVEATKEPQ